MQVLFLHSMLSQHIEEQLHKFYQAYLDYIYMLLTTKFRAKQEKKLSNNDVTMYFVNYCFSPFNKML